jgi:ribosomal protein L11 methylase PrmA
VKTCESGMPEESVWAGFFAPEAILQKLGLTSSCGDVVDFGCGYGTFTIPAARMIAGTVHALDIGPEMIRATEAKAREAGLQNVKTYLRDFVADGTGLRRQAEQDRRQEGQLGQQGLSKSRWS